MSNNVKTFLLIFATIVCTVKGIVKCQKYGMTFAELHVITAAYSCVYGVIVLFLRRLATNQLASAVRSRERRSLTLNNARLADCKLCQVHRKKFRLRFFFY